MSDHATFDLLFYLRYDIMDLHMSSLGTLVPEGPAVYFIQQGVTVTDF